jgi:hypothetical protein
MNLKIIEEYIVYFLVGAIAGKFIEVFILSHWMQFNWWIIPLIGGLISINLMGFRIWRKRK